MKPRLARLLAATARMIGGASVRRLDTVPDTRQRIYFANHSSHLDSIVLWAALPEPVRVVTRPVAARDYWGKGLRLKLATEVFNAILIDRERVSRDENPIEAILREMGDRYSIIIFPEGTRGSGDEVQPFKSGLFHLARSRPEVELVPVYMENLNRILPKGEVVPIPLLSSLSFGAPIRLEPDETKDAFLTRAREAVVSLRNDEHHG